jgi:FAD/FMN-containing dehydrogenase/Fe-S oxidoreductase
MSTVTRLLERALRDKVRGKVLFGPGERALYATDGSNYRHVPIGVVRPVDAEDVGAALRVCAEHGAPILPRGGGTSLGGQCCNVAVVFDYSRHMNRVLSLDPEARLARVQPGTVLDTLRDEAVRHGLTFAPDPSTHGWCTLGGMIGNNSCGVHSVMGGRTSDNVHALEVLTADGEALHVQSWPGGAPEGGRLGAVLAELHALVQEVGDLIRARYPKIPRRISGYNLDDLLPERGFHVARSLVGSEGTCVSVVEATVQLVPWPAHRVLLVVGYPDVYEAADQVLEVLEAGPIGLEGLDRELVTGMLAKGMHTQEARELPEGDGWLLVEFGGESVAEARDKAERLARRLRSPSEVLVDPHEQERMWKVREAGLPATARIPGRPDTWEGWEDSAVPPARLGAYLRELRTLLGRYGYRASTYGHFGDGCVHTRIPFELREQGGIARFRTFLDEASELVLAHGGSLSGEHGDGQARSEMLGKMFGPELVEAFRRFKRAWDPDGRMNPGRIVDPAPITADLRVAGVPQRPFPSVFRYPSDAGSLQHATERCVGVGRCRRLSGGTMCPSYQVTREERHSTRGRARLLYEMLRSDSPAATPRGERDVHDALDLCLSCKGCKSDCPMGVDLATYKAEFAYRWYRRRLRPRIAYAFGYMPWLARLLGLAPRLVNLLAPLRLVKWLIGMHPLRSIPPFARETFRRQLRRRASPQSTGQRVVLWVDSWTERFHPEVGLAAVEVLERLGFQVVVPPRALCCGRSLYDHGMLDAARRALSACLDATRPYVDEGLRIVVLEPSCASVFRDELPNLLAGEASADRLAGAVVTLAELLCEARPDLRGSFGRSVLYHAHCHHKAVLGTSADVALLRKLGAQVEVLDVGCCGMSGIFGYEPHKYEISKAIGEHGVLPAVRRAGPDTIVCADGFSCRSQLLDLADTRALHLAEVVRLALEHSTYA